MEDAAYDRKNNSKKYRRPKPIDVKTGNDIAHYKNNYRINDKGKKSQRNDIDGQSKNE